MTARNVDQMMEDALTEMNQYHDRQVQKDKERKQKVGDDIKVGFRSGSRSKSGRETFTKLDLDRALAFAAGYRMNNDRTVEKLGQQQKQKGRGVWRSREQGRGRFDGIQDGRGGGRGHGRGRGRSQGQGRYGEKSEDR